MRNILHRLDWAGFAFTFSNLTVLSAKFPSCFKHFWPQFVSSHQYSNWRECCYHKKSCLNAVQCSLTLPLKT